MDQAERRWGWQLAQPGYQLCVHPEPVEGPDRPELVEGPEPVEGPIAPTRRHKKNQPRWPVELALCLLAFTAGVQAEPSPSRQQQLVRMVRQDCGSCHGMRLTGGLGPALTREAMGSVPTDSIAATIFHGRPGTPMPPWRAMLDESEARWIAQRLQAGFPDEAR